jgi:hypothetical protein
VAIPPLLNRIFFRVRPSSCGGPHLDAAIIALAPASLVFPPVTITGHQSPLNPSLLSILRPETTSAVDGLKYQQHAHLEEI